MSLQELQIYALWGGKQSAKGTPNNAPATRLSHVAGDFKMPREDGSEAYSEGTQFVNKQDWVNTLVGNGNPGLRATPDEVAWAQWMFEGGEVVTPIVGPPEKNSHATTALPGLGHWGTYATRKGSSVLQRHQHNDAMIGQVEIGGSTGSKAIRYTPQMIVLDPGQVRAADPVAAMPVTAGFLYTDGTGRFKIDETVFRGHSEFTALINKDLQPVYSDDVVVYDLAIGNAVITIAVTLYFDQDGLAQFNKLLYDDPAPAAGAKPARYITGLGSYGFDLQARDTAGAVNGDAFRFGLDGVKWNVPDSPEPNPAGGTPTITLNGEMRQVDGSNPYDIEIDCDADAFTV
jgi:hypothetical protein